LVDHAYPVVTLVDNRTLTDSPGTRRTWAGNSVTVRVTFFLAAQAALAAKYGSPSTVLTVRSDPPDSFGIRQAPTSKLHKNGGGHSTRSPLVVKERTMKSNASEPNRLSRTAAKEVPHRSDERFFAAKADVKKACEDLLHDLRHSSAHEPMVADLTTAVNRVQQQLKDIAPDEPKASSQVRDIAKEVQHLQLAETWVSSCERVLGRLGGSAPTKMRDELLES
jgi:hypothetical protein